MKSISQENTISFISLLNTNERNHMLFRTFIASPVGHSFNSYKLIALSQISENKKYSLYLERLLCLNFP